VLVYSGAMLFKTSHYMKTLSLICCLLLAIYGFYTAIIQGNEAGHVVFIIGALAFCIIVHRTDKIAGYNKKHWMNR
jgi:hypothetical protein